VVCTKPTRGVPGKHVFYPVNAVEGRLLLASKEARDCTVRNVREGGEFPEAHTRVFQERL